MAYTLPYTGDEISAALGKADSALQAEEGLIYGIMPISQADYDALVAAGTVRTDIFYAVDDTL